MTEIIAVIEQKAMGLQNSSEMKGDGNLARVTAVRAETVLRELANLRDDLEAISRFEKKYRHFMPQHQKHFVDYVDPLPREGFRRLVDDRNILMWSTELRYAVQAIWKAPDPRTKEWGIFRLIDELEIERSNPRTNGQLGVFAIEGGRIKPLAPASALEQTLWYLRKRAHQLGICCNVECPTPYFFAKRKGQKYCCVVCALPSQRESKREWWAKHGSQRRRGAK